MDDRGQGWSSGWEWIDGMARAGLVLVVIVCVIALVCAAIVALVALGGV